MDALTPLALPIDLTGPPDLNQSARRGEALKNLEGLFLQILMKEMRKSVPESGLYGKSPARAMFQEMLDEVIAQKMTESGQLGIAKLMEDQIELQSKQSEVREALGENLDKGAFLDLNPQSGTPEFFGISQDAAREAFRAVKSQSKAADMFSVHL